MGRNKSAITNSVRSLRQQNAITQAQLGQLIGVSRQTVNSIEQGRYIPSLETALRIAAVFDQSVESIFRLEAE